MTEEKMTDRDDVGVLNVHRPPPEDSELRARLEELSERIDLHAAQLDRPRRLKRRTEDLVDAVGSTDPRTRERMRARVQELQEGLTGTTIAVTAVSAAVVAVQRVLDKMPTSDVP